MAVFVFSNKLSNLLRTLTQFELRLAVLKTAMISKKSSIFVLSTSNKSLCKKRHPAVL